MFAQSVIQLPLLLVVEIIVQLESILSISLAHNLELSACCADAMTLLIPGFIYDKNMACLKPTFTNTHTLLKVNTMKLSGKANNVSLCFASFCLKPNPNQT